MRNVEWEHKADSDRALTKDNKLQTNFSYTIPDAITVNPGSLINGRKKTRLLVKKGRENIAVRLEDIVLIYTRDKLVYVIDQFLKKYISDKPLIELAEELDSKNFFRANRQYIVNINYIKSFKSCQKVKLLIDITVPEINHSIIISQKTAPAFKKWMHDA